MITRREFRTALGEPDVGFDQALDAALRGLPAGEERPVMRKKLSLGLIAALIAALALTGAAFALSGSNILARIFTHGAPDERAGEAVRHPMAQDTCPYGTLTVTDYVMDGRNLYVEWTFETDSTENLLLQGELLVNGTGEGLTDQLRIGSDESGTSSIAEDTSFDLRGNAAQTRRMRGGAFTAMSHTLFAGDAPTRPFEVCRTLVIVRPLGDVAAISSPEEGFYGEEQADEYGWPSNLIFKDGLEIIGPGGWFSQEPLEEGGPVTIRTQNGWNSDIEDIPGVVLATLEARFTVDPSALPNVTVALSEPASFPFGDFELTVSNCEFTGFSAQAEYELRPLRPMNRQTLALWGHLRVELPDGSRADLNTDYTIDGDGVIHGLIWSDGGFTATPEFIRLIPVEYAPRDDDPDELEAILHEENAVTLRLSPAS